MKPEIKTSFHNRFDIYKTNAETGETVQIAYAQNIVLDAMWTRLCNFTTYFANIHYGTGMGTLSTSRTSLFTHLGTKIATDDVLTRTLPTASWRRKIVLNPEDNVGAVLTEIGIAYGSASSQLVTHALLRDMNGNVVSITKTAVDLITIYATVYVTFSTSSDSMVICGMPDSNPLMNYFIGGSGIGTCYFFMGEMDAVATKFAKGIIYTTTLGNTVGISWIADVANRKMTTSTPRLL